MASEPSDSDDLPTNVDGFKTSQARYAFNIDRLEKKYANMNDDVEVDLRTFNMAGEDRAVKKEFKKLGDMRTNFSLGTLSAPVAHIAELETAERVAKNQVMNGVFMAKHQGSLGLPAPPIRPALMGPSTSAAGAAVAASPVTRSRSNAMMIDSDAPSSSRVPQSRGGGRKSGGAAGVVVAVAAAGARPGSGVLRATAMMIDEEDEAERLPSGGSGIFGPQRSALGALLAESDDDEPRPRQRNNTATVAAADRVTPRVRSAMEDGADDDGDAVSGYGGGGGGGAQRTPPNLIALPDAISSRTRSRLLPGGARQAAIAAPVAPLAIKAAAPAVATGSRVKKTPKTAAATAAGAAKSAGGKAIGASAGKGKGKKKNEGPAGTPKGRGRKSAAAVAKQQQEEENDEEEPATGNGGNGTGNGEEEAGEKNERKRSASKTPTTVPKKRQAIVQPPPAAAAATGPATRKSSKQEEDLPLRDGSATREAVLSPIRPSARQGGRRQAEEQSEESELGAMRDEATGRDLVRPMETASKKKDRISSWVAETHDRTLSDYGSSMDESSNEPCSSTSTGDFDKDKDVEMFELKMRRNISSARQRNVELKMGFIRQ